MDIIVTKNSGEPYLIQSNHFLDPLHHNLRIEQLTQLGPAINIDRGSSGWQNY